MYGLSTDFPVDFPSTSINLTTASILVLAAFVRSTDGQVARMPRAAV